jgi:hypothetical protein
MFCLRRIWSSLRLFVGGPQPNRILSRACTTNPKTTQRITTNQKPQLAVTWNDARPHCSISNILMRASLPARSSKRHGPLVLCPAGGKG